MATTLFRRNTDMARSRVREPRGGKGEIQITEIVGLEEGTGRQCRLIHDVTIPAGTAIGVHKHETDAEYYYFLSGKGKMTLDGKEHDVGPGDLAATYPGGTHGLTNETGQTLRMIAVSVHRGEQPPLHGSATTHLVRGVEIAQGLTHACHGGIGTIRVKEVIRREPGSARTRLLRILHDDIIPVGTTIGNHAHGAENDEEYYYLLSGRGVMVLDGQRFDAVAGDVGCVFPGGSHAYDCRTGEDTRMLVVGVFRAK